MADTDYYQLGVQVVLFCGVLAIGIALGAALGLVELQTSCVAAGKLPAPGASLVGIDLEANACWQGATRMQAIANYSGGLGAVLLLGGGVLDRFEERVRGVVE